METGGGTRELPSGRRNWWTETRSGSWDHILQARAWIWAQRSGGDGDGGGYQTPFCHTDAEVQVNQVTVSVLLLLFWTIWNLIYLYFEFAPSEMSYDLNHVFVCACPEDVDETFNAVVETFWQTFLLRMSRVDWHHSHVSTVNLKL